ncbi:hypothetical protein DM455_06335 [Legionella pneumophila]|uniref:hypothetical protein n=1 Tax=Legionella pneumophila TaxID=446 RepID=UPI000D7CFC06|nr:hypothetical protein [Legionella pneumophila]PYB45018.1 hypothetical protein DM454_06615 [Legionella pneumophila]PYB51658.1 hypothetical protein DM456_06915 [Legionella pneumophila]PYB63862.1 hypothetical protein DM455_06335 [Legionella pneumophila]TID60549.1 hypothetical protein DIZ40_06555 [Legionella pneumophila]TID61662.1 hypothetical protein DIZ38_05140 [Legionella pneumophila]
MVKEKKKSNWTLGESLGVLGSIIVLVSAIGVCFKLYYDVQWLKDLSANQQADIYQLERKIKELSILSGTIINQTNLSAEQKKELTDQANNIQIDWYRHSNSGKDETKAMLPDYGKQE